LTAPGADDHERAADPLRRSCVVTWVLGLTVIAVFATAQFAHLGAPLLWQDEAETAMFGRRILETGLPTVHGEEGVVYGMSVPMVHAVDPASGAYTGSLWGQYYLAAAAVALSGLATDLHVRTSLVRLPFAAIGSLGLVLLWLAYRRTFEAGRPRVAMACAYWLGLAASVSLLLHLREVRYYAPMVLGVAVLVFIQRQWTGPVRSIATAISLFLLFNVFYPAAVAVALWIGLERGLPLLRAEGRTPEALRAAVLDAAALAAAALALAPIVAWFRMVPLSELMSARYHFGVADYAANVIAVLRHLAAHEWLLAAGLLRIASWQLGRREMGHAEAPALWRLVLVWIAVGARNPIFFERYFVALGPLLLMAALLDFDRVRRGLTWAIPDVTRSRRALAALAVVCVAGTLALKGPELAGRARELAAPVRGPLDVAIPWVASRHAGGVPPVVATNYEAEAWMFYLGARVVGRFHDEGAAVAKAEAAVRPDFVVPRRGYPRSAQRLNVYLESGAFERHALDIADLPYNTIPELSHGRVLALTHPFVTILPTSEAEALEVWARRVEGVRR